VSREVRLSHAAIDDLEQLRKWIKQPSAGPVAASKLADLLASLAELPQSAERYPVDPDRPSHRYIARHGYWIRFRIGVEAILVVRIFGPGQNRRGK
jgi:plasmid stabilization system protein ParE